MKLKEYLKTIYRRLKHKHVSYSQTGEDLIANFYLEGITKGFYVDVGANDPVYLNNTYLFYKKGWKGICIEPNIFRCKLIKDARPKDKVLNIGLANTVGEMDYYQFETDTISTLSKIEYEKFKDIGHKFLGANPVRVNTLSRVLNDEAPGKNIELLSIDTEGMDLEILQGNDWQKFRPNLIIVEIAEYRGKTLIRAEKNISDFLAEKKYHKLADTYINGIYIKEEYAKLKGWNF